MSSRKKLLFVLENPLSLRFPGPTRFLNMIKFLERYHDIKIIAKKDFSPLELKKGALGILGNTDSFVSRQMFKLRLVNRIIVEMMHDKPDFIIVRNYYYIPILKPLAKLFGVKLIYDMHCFRYQELNIEGRKIKAFFVRLFETLTHKLSDDIFVVSNDLLRGLLQKNVYLLPNGYNPNEFKILEKDKTKKDKALYALHKRYNISTSDKVVGFIGNIIKWMDIGSIISVAKKLPKYKLIIVGNDALVKQDRRYKKFPKNIIFTGSLDHKSTLMLLSSFDICLLPYRKDVDLMHLSIRKSFEYLAAGKPIIMSDSKINEQNFLKEKINVLKYPPENTKILAQKINQLLLDDALYSRLSKNNLRLSKRFTWEKRMLDSDIYKVFDFPCPKRSFNLSRPSITIVIKALNEENHIEGSLLSALKASKGFDGKVILVDSGSTDKTIEIAKKIASKNIRLKIYQLNNKKDACCGIGPQIGYLHAHSDFIYILDGDMTLDKDFIKNALPYFKDEAIAGIGGNIFEKSEDNLVFQVRSKNHTVSKPTKVPQLGMGGLYRMSALRRIGYFSNPYLYAYEEYDLAAKLYKVGFKLIRIPKKMIDHYGDEVTSLQTLVLRWKSRYLFGSGQYLKLSVCDGHFLRTLFELKIYVLTLIWIFAGIFSLIMLFFSPNFIIAYLLLTVLMMVILLIRKKNLKKTIFSLFSWTFQASGLFAGLFYCSDKPYNFKEDVKKIKR